MAKDLEVAIVFADVVGSTQLYDKFGDTKASETVAVCLDIMKDATYEPSVYEIEAKAILNAKISYAFWPGLRGFLSGYNLLFESSPEFFYSDRVDTSVMLGAEYDY